MNETSTTPVDNSADSTAGATTEQTPNTTGTDTQPVDNDNNLDSSKSTDTTADGDKSTTDTEDAPTSQFDSDIDEWAEKRFGSKPTTDEQRAAYQEARNEQREYTRSQQAKRTTDDAKALADEIQNAKADTSDDDDELEDPLEKDVKDLKEKLNAAEESRLQSEFYQTEKVTEAEGKLIVDIFKEKIAKATTPEAKKQALELWSKPAALPDLLELAKARIANGTDTSKEAAEEAARKERERIAKESQATSPGRGAKAPAPGNKSVEQERLERFSNWD